MVHNLPACSLTGPPLNQDQLREQRDDSTDLEGRGRIFGEGPRGDSCRRRNDMEWMWNPQPIRIRLCFFKTLWTSEIFPNLQGLPSRPPSFDGGELHRGCVRASKREGQPPVALTGVQEGGSLAGKESSMV